MCYYASQNFKRKSALKRAVRDGLPVVLFNPLIAMPAVNGEVVVRGPWDVERHDAQTWRGRPANWGWQARGRTQDMRIVAVLD